MADTEHNDGFILRCGGTPPLFGMAQVARVMADERGPDRGKRLLTVQEPPREINPACRRVAARAVGAARPGADPAPLEAGCLRRPRRATE
jgi:hypothetical protein